MMKKWTKMKIERHLTLKFDTRAPGIRMRNLRGKKDCKVEKKYQKCSYKKYAFRYVFLKMSKQTHAQNDDVPKHTPVEPWGKKSMQKRGIQVGFDTR